MERGQEATRGNVSRNRCATRSADEDRTDLVAQVQPTTDGDRVGDQGSGGSHGNVAAPPDTVRCGKDDLPKGHHEGPKKTNGKAPRQRFGPGVPKPRLGEAMSHRLQPTDLRKFGVRRNGCAHLFAQLLPKAGGRGVRHSQMRLVDEAPRNAGVSVVGPKRMTKYRRNAQDTSIRRFVMDDGLVECGGPAGSWSADAFDANAPEVAVSIDSARHGKPGIAMGNVVGNNIFELLFILAHLGHQRHHPTALGHGGLAYPKTRSASPQPP